MVALWSLFTLSHTSLDGQRENRFPPFCCTRPSCHPVHLPGLPHGLIYNNQPPQSLSSLLCSSSNHRLELLAEVSTRHASTNAQQASSHSHHGAAADPASPGPAADQCCCSWHAAGTEGLAAGTLCHPQLRRCAVVSLRHLNPSHMLNAPLLATTTSGAAAWREQDAKGGSWRHVGRRAVLQRQAGRGGGLLQVPARATKGGGSGGVVCAGQFRSFYWYCSAGRSMVMHTHATASTQQQHHTLTQVTAMVLGGSARQRDKIFVAAGNTVSMRPG